MPLMIMVCVLTASVHQLIMSTFVIDDAERTYYAVILMSVYFGLRLTIINCVSTNVSAKSLLVCLIFLLLAAVGAMTMDYLDAPLSARIAYSIALSIVVLDFAVKLQAVSFPSRPSIAELWQVMTIMLSFMLALVLTLLKKKHEFIAVGILLPVIGVFLLLKYACDTKIIVQVV